MSRAERSQHEKGGRDVRKNKALVRRIVDEAWNQGKLDVILTRRSLPTTKSTIRVRAGAGN